MTKNRFKGGLQDNARPNGEIGPFRAKQRGVSLQLPPAQRGQHLMVAEFLGSSEEHE